MTASVHAFEPEPRLIDIASILPSRSWPATGRHSRKFQQIRESIKEVGLIEPLAVAAMADDPTQFLLLDGHVRLVILKAMGESSAPCLIEDDDEAFTYNHRVNRLSTIQEARMIKRALERGVSAERLAKALNLRAKRVVEKACAIDNLQPETLAALKDREFSGEVSQYLRQMAPERQIECARLMASSDNMTVRYAKALLIASPAHLLVKKARKPGTSRKANPDQAEALRVELSSAEEQFRVAERTYGQEALDLVIVRAYVTKVVGHPNVARYLHRSAPALLEHLSKFAEATTLGYPHCGTPLLRPAHLPVAASSATQLLPAPGD